MALKEDIDQIAADAASIRTWAHGDSTQSITLGTGNVVRSPAKLIADNQAAISTGIVADGAISTVKLADLSVTSAKLAASLNLPGTPTAATAAVNTNTTQLATTAFVLAQNVANASTTVPYSGPNPSIGVSTKAARADHIHPVLVGSVVQHVYVQTRAQGTYSGPITGNGTEITPLNLVITPRMAGNRMVLEWHVSGEADNDAVFIVQRNGVNLTDTTDASNNRWAGLLALHDADTNSTPGVNIVRIIDDYTLGTATTYRLLFRSSNGGVRTLRLNRAFNSTGTDTYETGMSTATAMELQR